MLGYYTHKEGFGSIMCACVFALVLLGVGLWAGTLWRWVLVALAIAVVVIVSAFFRMPKNRVYAAPEANAVTAPADGRIVDISEVEEMEYFKGPRIRVSVFMSVYNVHVNRYPVSGRVVYEKYHPGKYLVAFHPKSSELNERNTTVVRTAGGTDILTRQIAGAVARRIVSYARKDDEVRAVQELGFIKFGSRVDVFLPLDADLGVKLDDKVKGGITCLALLKE